MTRRPAAVLPADRIVARRKRERGVRISTKRMFAMRPEVADDAASITHLGLDMFRLVKMMGYTNGAPTLFPAHLRRTDNAMGILAVRIPRQALG